MTTDSTALTFTIHHLDCPDCARRLEAAVAALPGVRRAELAFMAGQLRIWPQGDTPSLVESVQRLGKEMGYIIEPLTDEHAAHEAHHHGGDSEHAPHTFWVIAAAVALAAGLAAQWLGAPLFLSRLLLGASILLAGLPVAKAAWATLRSAHSLDMNALMTVAVIGAVALGDYAEGAVTMFLFTVGELLEHYSADRARRAIRTLMAVAPDEATRLNGETRERVPVAELRVGDLILTQPGERIAMDGTIVEGHSAVNQAPITGESVPVEKGPGEAVYAGTINGNGALTIRVTRLAQESTLARILRLVEQAQSERAPAQRFVDRFAQRYTPAVMAAALLVACVPPLLGLGDWATWFYRGLVLLVIACPCALVISTPVTLVSALARAARSGVLIKGGRYLEALARVKAIAFDKTGTLTEGNLEIVGGACTLHSETDPHCALCRDMLAKAAAIEEQSGHLVAQAVVAYAEAQGVRGQYLAPEGVMAHPGLGVTGRVQGHEVAIGSHAFYHACLGVEGEDALCSQVKEAERQGYTVLVAHDACCGERCYWAVADAVRPQAAESIAALRRLGVRHVAILTGDHAQAARHVAEAIRADAVYAGLLPEEKQGLVSRLEEEWGSLAMVGDGINDAPALAKASVGIAMGKTGADAALETADITLMQNDLRALPFAVGLSQRAMRIVRANVAFALVIKALFLGLAIAGYSTLWMAVLADTGAAILVTLNGLRLLAQGKSPASEAA